MFYIHPSDYMQGRRQLFKLFKLFKFGGAYHSPCGSVATIVGRGFGGMLSRIFWVSETHSDTFGGKFKQ